MEDIEFNMGDERIVGTFVGILVGGCEAQEVLATVRAIRIALQPYGHLALCIHASTVVLGQKRGTNAIITYNATSRGGAEATADRAAQNESRHEAHAVAGLNDAAYKRDEGERVVVSGAHPMGVGVVDLEQDVWRWKRW